MSMVSCILIVAISAPTGAAVRDRDVVTELEQGELEGSVVVDQAERLARLEKQVEQLTKSNGELVRTNDVLKSRVESWRQLGKLYKDMTQAEREAAVIVDRCCLSRRSTEPQAWLHPFLAALSRQ